MKPENLKLLINSFSTIDDFARLRKMPRGVLITTTTKTTVCNVFMEGESIKECVISKEKLDHLKALAKEYKKEDTPDDKIIALCDGYIPMIIDTDQMMAETIGDTSFSIDFKLLEKVYKTMKRNTNILKLDITKDRSVAIVSNEEGDLSLIGLHRS